ncbi:hypothetical protein JAAARDRAFT_40218 [Jaapia argillacea MUCL 33604]|uniref:Uncharacterized protein n=1 Tax=Jaapia argillacea MUCL 33604 TaxID=933084 RepID=A0A067PFJ7_9AGAM|nr:hypothetical protein JAAARDRAFT_40218 [Jaapia argillacea MUCL 33604]
MTGMRGTSDVGMGYAITCTAASITCICRVDPTGDSRTISSPTLITPFQAPSHPNPHPPLIPCNSDAYSPNSYEIQRTPLVDFRGPFPEERTIAK